jgi:site-specific DNA-adenine methylase
VDPERLPYKMNGSKRRSFAHIMPHLPTPAPGCGYIIPFFGIGGDTAHLCKAGRKIVRLGDANPHLAHLYRCLRDYPLETTGRISRLAATFPLGDLDAQRTLFGTWRDTYNSAWSQVARHAEPEVAALLTCLWRAGFNGILRANARGAINTPPGMTAETGPKKHLVDLDAVREFAAWLGKLPPVECVDYAALVSSCGASGDVVYYDPPYLAAPVKRKATAPTTPRVRKVTSSKPAPHRYFGAPFDTDRLVRFLQAEEPHAWGMSNAAHARWRADFPDAEHLRIYRAGTISSDGDDRGRVPEALIVRHLTS